MPRSSMRRPLSHRALLRAVRNSDGSVLIETAITTLIMMTCACIIMELSLAFYISGMISETAREGVRYAIVHGSTCATSTGASCTASGTSINTFTQSIGYPNAGGGALIASTTWPDTTGNCATSNAPGCRVKISISYTFPIHIPLVPSKSLALSTSAVGYILQ